MRSKTPTRGSPRTLRLRPETAVAVDDMMNWLEMKSKASLWSSQQGRLRILNRLIEAACEAVVSMEPPPCPAGVNEIAWSAGIVWPITFDARRETREEMDLRVMLHRMSAGEQDGEAI